MELGLEGQVAIVGGGSRGLGRACALGLAREGARVAICSRNADALGRTAQEISAETGADVLPVASDLSSLAGVKHLFDTATRSLGGVDIVVNNSGGPPPGTAEHAGEDLWEQAVQMSLMFFATSGSRRCRCRSCSSRA